MRQELRIAFEIYFGAIFMLPGTERQFCVEHHADV